MPATMGCIARQGLPRGCPRLGAPDPVRLRVCPRLTNRSCATFNKYTVYCIRYPLTPWRSFRHQLHWLQLETAAATIMGTVRRISSSAHIKGEGRAWQSPRLLCLARLLLLKSTESPLESAFSFDSPVAFTSCQAVYCFCILSLKCLLILLGRRSEPRR